MEIVRTIAELRACVGARRPAFVPTMGTLHEGHLALVRQARGFDRPVVASVFVNRLQFRPGEDFDRYPRDLERDAALLAGAHCDLLFAPDETALYPEEQTCRVHPDPAIADILEGHFRPGFFSGVCTVVLKLFACVQPSVAVFGKKDYQQWRVIEHMVRQLALPIRIAAGETCRAADGLALSSRNAYLSPAERRAAAALHASLIQMARDLEPASLTLEHIEREAHAGLNAAGWQVDYLCLRRQKDLGVPMPGDPLVAVGAARLGQTRLIDSLEIA